jgi:hypothetical protein
VLHSQCEGDPPNSELPLLGATEATDGQSAGVLIVLQRGRKFPAIGHEPHLDASHLRGGGCTPAE